MEYLQKVRSTVTKAYEQVGNVVAGNPALRLFEPGDMIGSAGPAHQWKIHKGKKRSTGQPVAMWIFERKQVETFSKEDQNRIIDLLKRGVNQLTRVRHPRVLVVEHPLEEGRDSFIFCTEPVIGSLANVLGQTEGLPQPATINHRNYKLHDIEIRIGLKQVAEALAFLHVDAKMLHRNVCPTSIILNERGDFKLAGFDFAMTASITDPSGISCDSSDIDDHVTWQLLPSIDFLAPEVAAGGRSEPTSDVFSLAVVAYSIFNDGKVPIECKNRLDLLRQNTEKLKAVPQEWSLRIPETFREDFKLCLNKMPKIRPDAAQFTKVPFFKDHRLDTVQTLESFMQHEQMIKIELLKKLPDLLIHFEKRLLVQKIRPCLTAEFSHPDLIPFILPSLFYIIDLTDKEEFTNLVMPELGSVFAMERPYQITILLLEKLDLFLSRAETKDVDNHILPCLYRAIKNENARIQEICLNVVPKIAKLISRHNMKTDVLPRLLALATSGDTLAVRVQSLICIGNLLPNLEEWMVTDQIFPAIPKINAKEPAILMAILGIYQRISTGFSISAELWARTALPYLIFSSVDMSLNQDQYLQYMSFIEVTQNKVKEEHLKKLATMSAGQDAARTGSASAVLTTTPKSDSMNALDAVFNPGAARPTVASAVGTPTKQNTGVLSLEEKRRLAAQQETVSPATNSTNDAFSDPFGKGKKVPMNQMKPSTSPQSTISTDWLSAAPAPVPQISPMAGFSSSAFGSFGGLSTGPPTSASNATFTGLDSMFPPSSSTTSTSSTSNFGNMASFGGLGLPQPPRSQNSAIHRKPGNPLDDLLSIGSTSTSTSTSNASKIPMNQMNQMNQNQMNQMNQMNGVQSNNMGSFNSFGGLTANSTTPKPNQTQQNDPFADLLS